MSEEHKQNDGGWHQQELVLHNRIRDLKAENERLRMELKIYRKALNRMTGPPKMDVPVDMTRYIAKDALRDGVRARAKKEGE